MNRSVPITLLQMLENWFSVCLSCVKWGHVLSHFYELKTGVRQGGVLSPLLFSIFMDRLASAVNKEKLGCRIGISCCAIFMYADDVILLAPTVHALQTLVNICEAELNYLDMAINVRKSACLRFGSRYKNTCANVLVAGQHIEWVNSARYLGVYFESSFRFKCTFTRNKANFYRSFNSIYGKIAHNASEEVLFELIRTKCVPVLLYGVEFCPLNSSDIHSLQFTMNKILFKIYGALSKDSFNDICDNFGIGIVKNMVASRRDKFVKRYSLSENYLCKLIYRQ